MSIKDRRDRQRLATREAILAAALQIARADGWEAVTVRRVADLIEYTPPIIYEYFANKAAMIEELQGRGFDLLAESIRETIASVEDGRERMLSMGDAYVRFAYDQPELYQIMHGWNSGEVPLDTTLSRATYVADVVQKCLVNWAAEQDGVLSDPEAALDIAWGLLHGLVSVEMLGRIAGGQERVRLLARQTLGDLLTAWVGG